MHPTHHRREATTEDHNEAWARGMDLGYVKVY